MKHPTHLFLVLLLASASLCAQAWLYPKGEGAVTQSYQNLWTTQHAYSNVGDIDIGHIVAHATALDFDYSVTDRLAVRVALPYIFSEYSGPRPHPTWIDNSGYHSTFQDFTFDVRYNLSKNPVVLTPLFRAVIPSHSYEFFAHSAVGRDLHEYQTGINFGRRLNPLLPKAYVQARYSYAFVERILGIAPNRSNVEGQLGYIVKPRLTLLGSVQWMYTHNGVDLAFGVPNAGLTAEQFQHHDQIAKASLVDLGGGLSYSVSPSWQVFISFARSVTGQNGHLHAAVTTVGISRSFGTRFAAESASVQGGPVPAPNAAFVCTCAKGN